MRSLISMLRLERLRNMLKGTSSDPLVKQGKSEVVEIQEAVAVLESLASDAMALHVGDEGVTSEAGNGGRRLPELNAFGRQVLAVEADSVSGSLAGAQGIALTGVRAAAFVSGDQLAEGFPQLQALAGRQVPMLVHAALREGSSSGSTHAAYHAASELGLFQVLPHSVQQAVDTALLARWVSERSLVPGLIGYDRHLVERAVLPSADLIEKFLGFPEDEITSATPAQLLLFGGKRPTIPRWFDLDRPVSLGSLQGSQDGASAYVGKQAFFWSHLPKIIEEGMAELSKLTGRAMSMITQEGLDDADVVIVTQGVALQTAKAVAAHLRKEKKVRVGTLGVTWLRPFPAQALAAALGKKSRILVLECASSPLAVETPLMRELKNCVKGERVWMSARYGMQGQPLHAGQLAELVGELQGKSPRTVVWMGVTGGVNGASGFPKREGMIQSVASDYPDLARDMVLSTAPLGASDGEKRTVQWVGPARHVVSEVIADLATAMSGNGGQAQAFGWRPEPGVLSVRVSTADATQPAVEAGTALDVLLLGRIGLDLIYNPLADMREGGFVVIDSDRTPQEIWSLMPAFWRSEVSRLNLRLFKTEGGLEDLLAAAKAVIKRSKDLPFFEIRWAELKKPETDGNEVPELIRRISAPGSDYDNLPRFWGEVMQPKRGGISENYPDPLVSVGAVPPYTAALARPRATALQNMPVLEAVKCTACGDCWPVCPDSAIGVTAVGIQELLDAAATVSGKEGKVAAAVKRSHKAVAAKIAALLVSTGERTLPKEVLKEAWRSVSQKLKIQESERDEHNEAFEATIEVIGRLKPVVSETFFTKAEANEKGSGKLVILTINPDSCQGCQICISTCPESALIATERGGKTKAAAQAEWKVWEQLPDTAGQEIEAAKSALENGKLAAPLMSRHCSQVQAVGSFGEPGSGERLAVRLVTGLAESVMQRRLSARAENARALAGQLREAVQVQLAEGLVKAAPDSIEQALKSMPKHRATLATLTEKLGELGKTVSVDPAKTLRLAQTAHLLEDEDWLLNEGVHGLGRARFGMAIVSHRVSRWAGRFPNHPYLAPLLVDPSSAGVQMVLGVAKAVVAKHVDKTRLLRKAELLKAAPTDLPAKLADLQSLSWSDLSDDERSSCPPILVVVDESALGRQGFGEIGGLLGSDMPLKVVVLDSCGLQSEMVEPTRLAMSHGKAFVASCSLSAPNHLADGVSRAIGYAGPALVHFHVPIPQDQGYLPARTLERARLAVESRVHPLVVYDPSAEGVLGTKVSLEGNPEIGADWAGLNPAEWLLGETRFSREFTPVPGGADTVSVVEYAAMSRDERQGKTPVVEHPTSNETLKVSVKVVNLVAERLALWKTYQEIAGIESPFTSRIRAQVESEVAAEHKQRVEQLKAEYEAKLAAAGVEADNRLAAQLRERLLSLAGFSNTSQTGNE